MSETEESLNTSFQERAADCEGTPSSDERHKWGETIINDPPIIDVSRRQIVEWEKTCKKCNYRLTYGRTIGHGD